VKGSVTRTYQIDVYGRERMKKKVWLCECKYTKTKMGIKPVRKLERAAQALRQEEEDAERTAPEIQMWLVSTGGFTRDVIEYAGEREDIFISDYDGINGIFRSYGGNYDIPVFRNASCAESG